MPARPRDDEDDRTPADPAPESGMGGASDMGAHGGHPASAPEMAREQRPADPEAVPGDAAIERRRRQDRAYTGPERRIARR